MNLRQIIAGGALAVAVIGTSFTLSQAHAQNVNPHVHPNLAEAQRFVDQALSKITDAQRANEYDMQNHAQRAKELLEQANRELKLAAETANRR